MKKLIALMLVQNIVIGQIQVLPEDGLDLFNNMMKYLFDNCRTEFGTIGFWGTDRIFLADDEVDFVLLNDSAVFKRSPTRRIKFLVEIYGALLNLVGPGIDSFEASPTPEIETVFVFDKGGHRPTVAVGEFEWYQKLFQNSKAYYCFERERQIGIITLNSFADVAPALWKRDSQTYSHINPDGSSVQWWTYTTVYKQETKFDYGSQLCKDIFFDRTEKLNGYTIKTAAKINNHFDPIYKKIDGLITKDSDISQVTSVLTVREGLFSKALADHLNVSIEITHGAPVNISLNPLELLTSGNIEMDLTPATWSDNDGEYDTMNYIYLSYPLSFFYEQIVTHNRGLATSLEKMYEFYGWLTPIATSIILLVALVVIYLSKSVNSSKFSFAVFECLRLLIGNSIYTRMDSAKMRIFFSVIFLYLLIIQATFSGHLAAFLTKPVYRKNVETLEDLEDPRYSKIYAAIRNADYINGTPLYNKTLFDDHVCKEYIGDPSVACINDQYYLNSLVFTYNLHTPKNFVKLTYSTLSMSHNSAFRHCINNLLMRLEQSGISNIWDKAGQKWSDGTAIYYLKKMEDIENYHRPIELGDVTFAFYLLGIGLFFAIISFILENSLKTFALDKIKISSWSSTVKRSTIHIVHFVIFKFRRLLKCLYINLVNVVDWVRVRI